MALAIVEKLVLEALATAATVHEQVLEFHQALEMHAHLRVAPAREGAHVAAAKVKVLAAHLMLPAGLRDHAVQRQEEPARLWGQLVEGPAQDLVGQVVRHRDVVQRHLDERHDLAVMLHRVHRPLILVQQRDGADKGQVLQVIPPRARTVVQEGQLSREGVGDEERPQEPLRVLVDLQERAP